MTHLFPRGNLESLESLDALRQVIEESIADKEIKLLVDMMSV